MNTPTLKSGFLTSEFWTTVANDIVGVLVALGYIQPQDGDPLVKAILSIVGGLMVIISTAIYSYGRYKLKQSKLSSGTMVPPLPMNNNIPGGVATSSVIPQ